MKQRRPSVSHESTGRLDLDQSLDPVAKARRKREQRIARIAAERRKRLRRTLALAALLVTVLAVGGIFTLSGGKAPVNAAKTTSPVTDVGAVSETVPPPSAPPGRPAAAATVSATAGAASTLSVAPSAKSTSGLASASRPASSVPSAVRSDRVSVIVWNGCGLKGVAHEAAATLKHDGFHVADVTNADRSGYEKTLIVVKDAVNTAAASAVRDSLHGGKIEVTDYYAFSSKVLVILGKDGQRRPAGATVK